MCNAQNRPKYSKTIKNNLKHTGLKQNTEKQSSIHVPDIACLTKPYY